jgi:hypothetical protein
VAKSGESHLPLDRTSAQAVFVIGPRFSRRATHAGPTISTKEENSYAAYRGIKQQNRIFIDSVFGLPSPVPSLVGGLYTSRGHEASVKRNLETE